MAPGRLGPQPHPAVQGGNRDRGWGRQAGSWVRGPGGARRVCPQGRWRVRAQQCASPRAPGLGQPEGSHSLCPQGSFLFVPLTVPGHTCRPYTCLPCSAFHRERSGAIPPAPGTQTLGPVLMALFFRTPSGPPERCSLVSGVPSAPRTVYWVFGFFSHHLTYRVKFPIFSTFFFFLNF